MANQLTASSLSPLIAPRSVFINSSTGSDTTGDGSSAHPWQTLAKGWADRLSYGELRAKYTINLMGVGPYTMPIMGASVCGDSGLFIIQGDPTVDVSIATGTFTGDIVNATHTLPTSAGLGSDTLKTYFLEITSGNCAGARVNINFNTDTSISVACRRWRALGAVANGDTFRVYAPGTVINVAAPATGGIYNGLRDWIGGICSAAVKSQQHIFFNVAFTGAGVFVVSRSAVAFVGVRSTATGLVYFSDGALISFGFRSDSSILLGGAQNADNKLQNCGYSSAGTSTLIVQNASTLFSTAYWAGSTVCGSVSIADVIISDGGRYDGAMTINGGRLENYSSVDSYLHVTKTITIIQNGQFTMFCDHGTKVLFAVTAGDCFNLQKGSKLIMQTSSAPGISGGTTDAAGYGIKLLNAGGLVVWNGPAGLTLTGGTPGADVKTTNLVQNNAFFANVGDFLADVGGAEVITRI